MHRAAGSSRYILITLFISAVALCVGVLIGRTSWFSGGGDEDNSLFGDGRDIKKQSKIIGEIIDRDNIGRLLRNLTLIPHLAGTPEGKATADFIYNKFIEYGLDTVELVPYDVLLSYSNRSSPNEITIIDEGGETVFSGKGTQPPIHSPEESSSLIHPNFNAYSKPGIIQGDPVYANYGRYEDFLYLKEKDIKIEGNIVIAKYGRISRTNIATFAEQFGAKGLIMYNDPKDAAPTKQPIYPNGKYMPGYAVQAGTTKLVSGDPLTPFYPATKSAYRLPLNQSGLSNILIQPLGYRDVEVIFRSMSESNESPKSWKGGLNVSYAIGPGFKDPQWKLKLNIKNTNENRTAHNVIGVVKGSVEPDRYVIAGNHHDAWIFGAIDPSSGTACVLEMARVLGKLKAKGWRPRRSIILASWDAEEYGLIGSVEWVQEFQHDLSSKGVAYINIDNAINGNLTFRALGVPLLYTLIRNVTKEVPNPNKTEVEQGLKTVYDGWLKHYADNRNKSRTWIGSLGGGSDFRGFIQNLGIPSADIRYQNLRPGYPLYHTLYETYYLASDIMDRGFHLLNAVTHVLSLIVINLSHQDIIPFDVNEYSTFFQESQKELKSKYLEIFSKHNITFEHFDEAVLAFANATDQLRALLMSVDRRSFPAVRELNDRLMNIERVFVSPHGLPNDKYTNHVIFSSSTKNKYAAAEFGCLADLVEEIKDIEPGGGYNQKVEDVKMHWAEIVFRIRSAVNVMRGSLLRV